MKPIKIKLSLQYFILLAILFTIETNAQCQILSKIINSNLSLEVKQQKIDSLFIRLTKTHNTNLGDCFHDLGNKWYFNNWVKNNKSTDLENAIFYTKKASEIKAKLELIDSISLKQSLYNLGFFNTLKGNIYEATSAYKKIILLNHIDELALLAKKDLGTLYLKTGDFHKAILLFNEIIETCQNIPENKVILLETNILLADTYGTMNYISYKNSIYKYLQKADSIIKHNNMENSFENNQVLLLTGNLLLKTENYNDAISKYKELLLNSDKFYKEELAAVHNNLGFCYLKINDLESAKKELHNSISLDSTHSNSYENLGDLFIKKREFGIGIEYYNEAIRISMGSENKLNSTQIPSSEELKLVSNKLIMLNHIVAKSNGWMQYYDYDNNKEHLEQALKSFELADSVVDLIRLENTEFQSKLYWREQSSALYMKAVKVCYLLSRPEKAFYFMERNKAILLLEDLSYEQAKDNSNLPEEIAQREFSLRCEVHLSENTLQQISTNISSDSVATLKNKVRINKYRYEAFVDSLSKSYPDYSKYKKNIDIISLDDLKLNYISESSATLHYILNKDDGYGLLTALDTTSLFQLNNTKSINANIEKLIVKLSDGTSNIDAFKKVSHSVFQQLIPNNIYDKIRGKKLIIIPDYILQRIPFEALVTDKTKLEYLLKNVEIGYTYSMSLMNINKHTRVNKNTDFLGLAPVFFDNLKLPQLYFSQKEVEDISAIYSGDTFLNLNASKANFKNNLDNYKIFHLATHADIGDDENPWVAFSDSKMYLKEIYATKTQANMVVLSACNTATGNLQNGEGVMSLARGFFYSGAKSVVSSLWPVADQVSKDILISFYQNLKKGFSKSESLQKAKLNYLKTTKEKELKHPYYWAGFVVLGDNSPISDTPMWPWFVVPILIGLVYIIYRPRYFKALRATA